MIKRGRPKGATAYPETAVCIKCRVFRPKRRGFCDRCRPRNRSSKSNMDVTSTTNPPAAATSSSACSTAVLRANTAIAPAVLPAAARQGLEPESRGVKRIKVEEEERATSATATTTAGNADTTAQIRAKRRRTVSAPAPVAAAQPLLTTADRNRNVDVIQAAANGKDPKFDVASPLFYPFATMSSTSAAAHHLAILLPRSDGTAVDIVPLQFLSTAPVATATTVSPSPSAFSPASSSSSSYTSSPASSPAALASTQALMSLASVSALAASHRHATASPASHSSASSPASSPPRRFFPASPQSSPSSTSSSFAAAPFAPSFAQPQQQHLQSLLQLHAATAAAAAAAVASLPTKAATSKAGDLMLPSLGSLALPRPALPPRNHFNLPGYATVPGVQLASFVSGTSGGGLRHQ